jgi:hypothetical protein
MESKSVWQRFSDIDVSFTGLWSTDILDHPPIAAARLGVFLARQPALAGSIGGEWSLGAICRYGGREEVARSSVCGGLSVERSGELR